MAEPTATRTRVQRHSLGWRLTKNCSVVGSILRLWRDRTLVRFRGSATPVFGRLQIYQFHTHEPARTFSAPGCAVSPFGDPSELLLKVSREQTSSELLQSQSAGERPKLQLHDAHTS